MKKQWRFRSDKWRLEYLHAGHKHIGIVVHDRQGFHGAAEVRRLGDDTVVRSSELPPAISATEAMLEVERVLG